jgi:hypothetical protein
MEIRHFRSEVWGAHRDDSVVREPSGSRSRNGFASFTRTLRPHANLPAPVACALRGFRLVRAGSRGLLRPIVRFEQSSIPGQFPTDALGAGRATLQPNAASSVAAVALRSLLREFVLVRITMKPLVHEDPNADCAFQGDDPIDQNGGYCTRTLIPAAAKAVTNATSVTPIPQELDSS